VQNLFFGKPNSGTMRSFSKWLATAITLATLAACGGGGAGGGTTATDAPPASPPATTVDTTAATVELLVSSPQIASAANSSVELTAIVLNAAGQGVPGKTVVFANATDGTALGRASIANQTTTDSNGVATATLRMGSIKTNRTINLTATTDAIVGTNAVDVIGTSITISGSTSLTIGSFTDLTILVKDSAGVAVTGVPVTVTSLSGNTVALTPASGSTTSPAGQVIARVTASTAAATDIITVTSSGASLTQDLTINTVSFAFTAPLADAEIPVNTATPIAVTWLNGAAPVAGTVNFSATRGALSATADATDGAGIATVNITSPTTGASILTASGAAGTPTTTRNIVFITNTASTITGQVAPSTVGVNTGSSTTNRAVISVVVRDAALNLVKDARVVFSLTDASGGTLSAGESVTNINGIATVDYIAGTTNTSQNGVSITATVTHIKAVDLIPDVPLAAPLTLTVAGQTLFVRLGTDNTVGTGSAPATNAKIYTALVTDAAGNAAPAGTQVRFVLRPYRYIKGYYEWVAAVAGPPAVAAGWKKTVNFACANEDLNFNGIADEDGNGNGVLDPGEDLNLNGILDIEDGNGNGVLDPGGAAAVAGNLPGGVSTTNADGFATATISYTKDKATWVDVILEARAGVAGNDPPALVTFRLPGLASDYLSETIPPPGEISPYGVALDCTDPN